MAVVSVTVNVCTLLRGIVSRVVFAAVCRRSRRRCSSSTLADCESGIGRRPTWKKPAHDDVLVSALVEMLLSLMCVALGLKISSSSSMTSAVSGLDDRPTLVMLSVALGRFVFTFVHLTVYPGVDSAWTMFRAIYVTVSVICLSAVIITGDILLVAAMILLMELGMAVEEASRVVERTVTANALVAPTAQDRLERVLTVLGIVLSSAVVPVPLTLLVVAFCSLQSSFMLDPPEFGLLCFAVLFYSLTAAFLFFFRRLRYRCHLSAVPRSLEFPFVSRQLDQLKRQPLVGAARNIDRKRRRTIKRAGVELLLHAVRSRRVCSVDIFNAVRIAAASVRGLPNTSAISRQREVTSSSSSS